MTQRQEFRLIRSYSDFELREYNPCVIAEVRVSEHYSSASSAAFGSLFRYISKGNKTAQKIDMTAPVITAQRTDKSQTDEWFVSFVMPSGSNIGHLPDPNDPNVVLRELGTETCIALSFRGNANAERAEKEINKLRAAALRENLSLSDESRICRFDPPFKPGFMQYNEIVIPVYLAEQ
jgi:hypothetical protein